MAKSDSTRKPLPKVWIQLDGRACIGYVQTVSPGAGFNQYAPLQKPRRCVWRKHGQTRTETSCGLSLWDDPAFLCCYNCGGRIVRRKR